MYYNLIKTPALIKTGSDIISDIDALLHQAHLYYPSLILVTQNNLFEIYRESIEANSFDEILLFKGGDISEAPALIERIKGKDSLIVAFGGGSILDLVKYCASRCDLPYITIPSTLSNDAIYSCVARLNEDGKKKSYGVQPPVGIIVDLNVIRRSPRELILAGAGDLITNLSALQDWKLAYKDNNEPINELAYMLAKEAALVLFQYTSQDLYTDEFLMDLANGLISSGLSMIVSGDTRGTSGAEHMISHAIDEFFSEKSTIHGLQAAWAFLKLEQYVRGNNIFHDKLRTFYNSIGLSETIEKYIPWSDEEFFKLIPYARQIRPRYTILSKIDK